MAENILNTILIQVDPKGRLAYAGASWVIRGQVAGYDADVPVSGPIVTKGITDQIDTVIADVLAQGPPPPVA